MTTTVIRKKETIRTIKMQLNYEYKLDYYANILIFVPII